MRGKKAVNCVSAVASYLEDAVLTFSTSCIHVYIRIIMRIKT